MPTKILGINDGPRLTVNQLMKSPTVIPARVLSMLNQQFLADALLRRGDAAPSGVVLYNESTPQFADADPAIMDEWGEIPVASGSVGTPKAVRTVRRALGVRVSKTMRQRNQLDRLNTQIVQVRNTMVRAWEDAFLDALLSNTGVQTFGSSGTWDGSSSTIRKDINKAVFKVQDAATDNDADSKLGFNPNTLVISTQTRSDLLSSDEIASVYKGNIASENLKYTGKLPRQILGLDVVVSWRLDRYAPGTAVVLERGTVGFISDERSGPNGVEATPLYGEGGGPNGGPTESWRADFTRQSAIGIDQPKAACIITGVHS